MSECCMTREEANTQGLKWQAQELIEQAYQRGFKAGWEDRQEWDKNQFDRLIEKGRNEAWEAASKLVSMDYNECNKVLGDGVLTVETVDEIFIRHTAFEAIDKLRAYEEQKKQEEDNEIKVGDEVYYKDRPHVKFVVTKIDDIGHTGYMLNGFSINGEQFCDKDASRWLKTGRHFSEIAEVLKKMKEGE